MGINTCPLEGKCQTSAVVYQATVSTGDGEIKTYTGCTGGTFKKRYYGHVADMRDRENSKNTRLAEYIWHKKDSGIDITNVKWKILKECHGYQPGGDKCDVCLTEKLLIMKNKEDNSLNKRTELMNKCRHKWRWRLANVKTK